jgi:NTE family protein
MSEGTADGDPKRATGDDPTRVAIACQGGGSHTAFSAGVLREILEDWDEGYELVGISGTSGGAFNALAAWSGLVVAGPELASELLGDLWDDLAVDGLQDRWLNTWATTLSRLDSAGFPTPSVSPYQFPGSEIGKQQIREVLEAHIDFETIPDLCTESSPELIVGTVDVNDGVFKTFKNEAVTVEAVLASAAVPTLFEAVEIDGQRYWDGLFSQNPPVRDLMHLPPARKPEELWIVQINPQEFEGEPSTTEVIADRRNELSGNISLNQELQFIEQVSEWVDDGKLSEEEFTRPTIHRIQMSQKYHCSTKVDRDPEFLAELRERGRERARTFLDQRV